MKRRAKRAKRAKRMLRQVMMQLSTDIDQHYCHLKSRMLQLFWCAFHGTEGVILYDLYDLFISIPINMPIIVVICNPSSYCILSILHIARSMWTPHRNPQDQGKPPSIRRRMRRSRSPDWKCTGEDGEGDIALTTCWSLGHQEGHPCSVVELGQRSWNAHGGDNPELTSNPVGYTLGNAAFCAFFFWSMFTIWH